MMASSIFAQLCSAKTKRQFVHPDSISRHLYCAVCHEVFQDPVRTICGHTFCYICIENWAIIQKICPICKQSIRGRKLEKDLIALNIIDDLIARCMYPQCNVECAYTLLKKHQRTCKHKPKKQLDFVMDEVQDLDVSYNQQSSCEVIEVSNNEIVQIQSNIQVVQSISLVQNVLQ